MTTSRHRIDGYLDLPETTTPAATPATGRRFLYPKAGGLYQKNAAGAESQVDGGGGGSSSYTDTGNTYARGATYQAALDALESSHPMAAQQGMLGWRIAMSKRKTLDLDILYLGDSLTVGGWATTHADRMISILRNNVASRLNVSASEGSPGGSGHWPTDPWTKIGGVNYDINSLPAGLSTRWWGTGANTDKATKLVYGKRVKVAFIATATSGIARIFDGQVQIGEVQTNRSNNGGVDGTIVWTSDELQNGLHLITVVNDGGTSAIGLEWIQSDIALTGNVRIHEAAMSGLGWQNWAAQPTAWNNSVARTNASLVIYQCGINDANGGRTTGQVAADIATVHGRVSAALPQAGYLMVLEHWNGDAAYTRAQWQAYTEVMRAWAIANNVAVLDMEAIFGSTASDPWDLMTAIDDVHPNDYGHRLYGEAIAAFITAGVVDVETEKQQDTLLLKDTYPPIPDYGYTEIFADLDIGTVSGRNDMGTDAFGDFRRARGIEMKHWRSALGDRDRQPVNLYITGDSLAMGGGQTSWGNSWTDILRDSLQREYRNGGVGFIPTYMSPINSFPNRWTLAAGVVESSAAGFGRRSTLHTGPTQTATITEFCDRFYIHYFTNAFTANFTVTVDGVLHATVTAAEAANIDGRVYDSGQLDVLGYHTIVIAPVGAGGIVIFNGGTFFAGDHDKGVHVFHGGRGGFRAEHMNGDTGEDISVGIGARRNWPTSMWQPHTRVLSGANGITGNGTTTVVFSGAPAFTTNDIGECIYADSNVAAFPRGLRIVSVTNATTVVVNKVVPSGTYTGGFTRARYTDVSRTINTNILTSASQAQFTTWDVGKTISGDGLIAGTVIKRRISATQVEIFPQAFSTGSGGTLQIKNRQARPLRPDMFMYCFGGNDMFAGVQKSEYKANMKAVVDTMIANAFLDVPIDDPAGQGYTGIYNDERPSVCLMAAWGTAYISDANLNISATSGSNQIGRATTGVIRDMQFTPADIGRTFSGAPVNGLSITRISPDGQTAWLSGNATATTTNTTVIMLQRNFQPTQWHKYRAAMYELCKENNWVLFDLYNIGGFAGVYDQQQLICYDGLHPGDRGGQWIADEASTLFGGVKKLASIPQGIFDNPGEMIVAEAADKAKKVPGVKRKTTADVTLSATVGTYTDITELAFPIGPGETLSFQMYIFYTSPLATSGLTLRLAGSAGMSTPASLCISAVAPASASTVSYIGLAAPTAWPQVVGTAGGSAGSTIPVVLQVYGQITAGAKGGIITPQVTAEIAASAPVIQRDSYAIAV